MRKWLKKPPTKGCLFPRVKWKDTEGTAILLCGEDGEMQVAQTRVLALADSSLYQIRHEARFAETIVKMIVHNLRWSAGKGTQTATGQLHPAYKLWAVRHLRIQQEVLQRPTTISQGIFPVAATMDVTSIPDEVRDAIPVDSLEDTDSAGYDEVPYGENCMISIRAGNRKLLERMVKRKVIATAQQGKRVLLVVEMGPKEITNPRIRFTPLERHEATVEHHHLGIFPAGTTIWCGEEGTPGAWKYDARGRPYGTTEDGAWDSRRSLEGEATGVNVNRLEMHLYCPKDRDHAEGLPTDSRSCHEGTCVDSGQHKFPDASDGVRTIDTPQAGTQRWMDETEPSRYARRGGRGSIPGSTTPWVATLGGTCLGPCDPRSHTRRPMARP